MKHTTRNQWIKTIFGLSALSGIVITFNCYALTANNSTMQNIAVQVPQTFYKNPVRMLHPYMNYWHNRGEALALTVQQGFQPLALTSQSCEQADAANALVVLEPNMFYNPQLRVFHSQITAKVYTQNTPDRALTAPDLVVSASAQQLGELSYQAEYFMQKAYTKALVKVSEQLAQSEALKQKLAHQPAQSYQALCQSLDTINQPKVFF